MDETRQKTRKLACSRCILLIVFIHGQESLLQTLLWNVYYNADREVGRELIQSILYNLFVVILKLCNLRSL